MQVDNASRNRNRMLLLGIFALFFGSLIFAGVLRFSGWRPSGMKNKGELLQPPADLRKLTPKLVDGSGYRWTPVNRTWRIAIAPPAECGDACATVVRNVDTVWRLLGREADRVDVLWVCPQLPCAMPAGAPAPQNLRLLAPDASLRGKLPRVDATSDVAPKAAAAGLGVPVYVIDPNGFVILRYAPGFDPSGLRTDVARLVKLK